MTTSTAGSTSGLRNAATAPTRDLLGLALVADAAVTGLNGLAYLAAAGPLGDLFDVSPAALRGIGAFLVAVALALAVTATRRGTPRRAVAALIATNATWAAGSVVLAVTGWGDPSVPGTVWITLQALVVGGFAVAQAVGLARR